jgi:putative membrane protein
MPLDSAWGMHDGWSWLWGGLMMVLFWGLVIWGTIALVRRERSSRRPEEEKDDAVAVLRRRYAAGELTGEEYERRLAALSETVPSRSRLRRP